MAPTRIALGFQETAALTSRRKSGSLVRPAGDPVQERGELTGANEMVDVITKMRVVSARHYGQMSQWGFHTLTMGAAEPSPIVFHRTALLREPPVAQHVDPDSRPRSGDFSG